jgi:drug/metabolite transporter (DMT)-like permease
MNRVAAAYALVSAALFGVSTPAAKALLGAIDPGVLAGLLYCGAGVGVAILRRVRPFSLSAADAPEIALTRADIPWLAGAIIAGGVVGPVLLMFGLAQTDASAASLLLTLEGAFTALMAWFIFHENFDRRIALGLFCIVLGAAVLSWPQSARLGSLIGPLMIVVACLAWGLDNNLTRKISLSDPLQIVEWKGLVAGPVNLLLAWSVGGAMPAPIPALVALFVGFLGYGVSLALFVIALRHLGTARTSAYFSTSPFLGAVAAVLMLGEPATARLAVSGALMALGVWLHLTERHEHEHLHSPVTHSHPHTHDEHHRHEHGPADPPGEPHTHAHRHAPLRHAHPHVPDVHHQHRH